MVIRKSAAGAIHALIADLTHADPMVRETAGARLAVIGQRAVPHLLDAFHASPSAVGRAHMLHLIEASRDRRGIALAVDLLGSGTGEPVVSAAAIRLLGSYIDDESTEALEALGAVALDDTRPEADRLAAWGAMSRLPARILSPLRKRLAKDPHPALRAAAEQNAAAPSPAPSVQSLAADALQGEPVDPAALAESVRRSPRELSVPTLHQIVEAIGKQERAAATAADRREWMLARAAVHQTLAERGSRVALYDVRDTLDAAAGQIPEGFLAAVRLVGDAACLESIAGALARVPERLDRSEQRWRDQLIESGRAIVEREHLTRRQAVIRRLARKHPDIVRVLLAPDTQGAR